MSHNEQVRKDRFFAGRKPRNAARFSRCGFYSRNGHRSNIIAAAVAPEPTIDIVNLPSGSRIVMVPVDLERLRRRKRPSFFARLAVLFAAIRRKLTAATFARLAPAR